MSNTFSESPTTAPTDTPEIKRNRAIASTYPQVNSTNRPSNPFSRSAAKRDSVMALGSIEHLQHYFTKTGLATKRKTKHNKNLVPALGPSVIPTLQLSSAPSINFELPSPVAPQARRPAFPSLDRSYQVDPDALKPGVIRDLDSVEKAWRIGSHSINPTPNPDAGQPALLTADNVKRSTEDFFDILSVLQITTRTIRSVRNYLVSLPDDNHSLNSSHSKYPVASLRKHSQSRVKQTANSAPNSSSTGGGAPFPSLPPDRLTRIRNAALDVLAALRLLEESNRIPLSDDAYDGLSVGSGAGDVPISTSDEFIVSSRASSAAGNRRNSLFSGDEDEFESTTSASPSNSATRIAGSRASSSLAVAVKGVVPLQGPSGVIHVWSDGDDDDEFNEPDEEKRDHWDERLVLGGGWLYKHVPIGSLEKERDVVARYLDVVDELLFGGPKFTTPQDRTSTTQEADQAATTLDPTVAHSATRRGWHHARQQKPRKVSSRSSLGAPSTAPSEAGNKSITTDSPRKISSSYARAGVSRRLPSSGLFDALRDMQLTGEPEEMVFGSPGTNDVDRLIEEGSESEDDLFEGGEWPDEELPEWARRDQFVGDAMGRLHSILVESLPSDYISHLPSAKPTSDELLIRLSDGQLLCHAYNAIVRKSPQPWGFIGGASVHDIIGLEEKERQRQAQGGSAKAQKAGSSWTFRRTENLRLWAAALKLRYMIALAPNADNKGSVPNQPTSPSGSSFINPLGTPSRQPVTLPSAPSNSPAKFSRANFDPPLPPTPSKALTSMGPSTHFDPRGVARRDEGWESMFEQALGKWVDAIVKERREKARRR